MLSPLILAAVLAQTPNFDQLSMIREFPGKPGKNTFLQAHDFNPANTAECIGAIKASDVKFQAFGGKKPVRFIFTADRDGDGSDETIVVREDLKTHQLQLGVFSTPLKLGKKAKLIASSKKNDLGLYVGAPKIVAMGRINVDDDAVDEIAIVLEALNGSRSLIVRELPSKKNASMGFPIRSDLTFGQVGTEEYLFPTGQDVDEDPEEELVCLRRATGQPDQLVAFDAPVSLFAEVGSPVCSDTNVNAVDGAENVGFGFLSRSGLLHLGLIDKSFLAFYRKNAQGNVRVDCYDLPTGVGVDLGPIVCSDQSLDPGAQDIPEPIALTTVKRVSVTPPDQVLSGSWDVEFTVIPTGSNTPVTLGPFPAGIQVAAEINPPNQKLTFSMVQFNATAGADVIIPLDCTLSSLLTGATGTWQTTSPVTKYDLPAYATIGATPVPSFQVEITHASGILTHTPTQMVLARTILPGAGAQMGRVVDPTKTPVVEVATVRGYRYVKSK